MVARQYDAHKSLYKFGADCLMFTVCMFVCLFVCLLVSRKEVLKRQRVRNLAMSTKRYVTTGTAPFPKVDFATMY